MTPHEFDHLPFPARMRALAEYARALDAGRYRDLRAALDAGDPDERHTALFLAVARRDLGAVTAALDDPLLRSRALAAAIRLPIPEQALAALALSEIRAIRHDTYRVLRLSRRRALADLLLPQVHERYGRAEAARLLPGCTPGTAGEWLPRLDAPQGVLRSLARTAPRALAAQLAANHRASTDPQQSGAPRSNDRRLVTTLVERDPDAGMLLLERAPELLTERAMSVLLRRPRAVLESVRRTGTKELPLDARPLPRAALRALRALGPHELTELAGICASSAGRGGPYGTVVTPDPLLLLLPADARRRLVEARVAEANGGYGLPLTAVAALAPVERAELLEQFMPRLLRSPRWRRRVAAVLPLPVAEPLIRELTDSHRVYERAQSWPVLLASAQLQGDPADYARIVASCERAWHDQEMVRHAALTQAAATPARLLGAVPPHCLRDMALTTVQSRDSTARSLAAAERWLRRTVTVAAARGDGERAAAVALLLAEIVADPRRAGGAIPLKLGDHAARLVWEAARRTGPCPRHLVALAELLAGNGVPVPELDALVERTALSDGDPRLAARAADVWLADPGTRAERCGRLIAADPAFASVPRVQHTLANRRTDLLDAALDPGATTRTAWVPALPPSVTGRWLPRQRALLDQRLVAVATDEDATLRRRADAAALLRDDLLLRRLADDAPQPVAAAALTALGGLGTGALGLLLEHAAGAGVRGKAAMAAVRRLLGTMPGSAAVALLAPVVRDRAAPVGTRKEAARALAELTELPGESAFAALLAGWDAPGQHRDVLAVLARPLVSRIDQPPVAARLAAQLHQPAVCDAVITGDTSEVPVEVRGAYARFVAGLVPVAEPEIAGAVCRAMWQHRAWPAEEVAGPLSAAVADPGRPCGLRESAAAVLTGFAASSAGLAALRAALDALAVQGSDGPPDVRRSALRILHHLVKRYGQPSAAVLDVVTDALLRAGLRRTATATALDAALTAMRAGDPAPDRWDRWLGLVAEHPHGLDLGQRQYLDHGHEPLPPAVHETVVSLRGRGAPAAGLVAVEVVGAAGRRSQWQDPWPAELAALCADPHPGVAESALLVDVERTTA